MIYFKKCIIFKSWLYTISQKDIRRITITVREPHCLDVWMDGCIDGLKAGWIVTFYSQGILKKCHSKSIKCTC